MDECKSLPSAGLCGLALATIRQRDAPGARAHVERHAEQPPHANVQLAAAFATHAQHVAPLVEIESKT